MTSDQVQLLWCRLDAVRAAEQILSLSIQGYRREAALIEAEDFPPLREKSGDIAASSNQFFAATTGAALDSKEEVVICGVVEMISHTSWMELSRLVVADNYLRQGIASFMLHRLLQDWSAFRWQVDTAQLNHPALTLYENFGFVETRRWVSPEGYGLVSLERVSK